MHHGSIMRLVLFVSVFVVFLQPALAQFPHGEPAEQLRQRIEVAAGARDIAVGSERIHAEEGLAGFYEGRGYRLAWIDDGRPTRNVEALLAEIRASQQEGVRPGDYHLSRLQQVLTRIG